ncbi:glycosyltransferase [Prolixibacteraceae bacterium]|nr:glycosyltransferase [Prolixibacteraceae bacterium]
MKREDLSVGVVVSTYNKSAFLDLVLMGLSQQTYRNFTVYIADDGSTDNTSDIIAKGQKNYGLNLVHVWHEDRGFQKCLILNKAIARVIEPYVIFLDGDVIPQSEFVEFHVKKAQKGRYISSGAIHLKEKAASNILAGGFNNEALFGYSQLKSLGQPFSKNYLKLNNSLLVSQLLNTLFFFNKATFNGNNSSCWHDDLMKVGGFNTAMGYGAEDRELGTRLENNGIKGIQCRYLITGLHMFHTRPYKSQEVIAENRKIWDRTKKEKIKSIEFDCKSFMEEPINSPEREPQLVD